MKLDRQFAQTFAQQWVDAWNSGDLEQIFAHYADDFEMRSPLIAERGFSANGQLVGKDAIRPYWTAGLAVRPALRFALIDVYVGAGAIALHYRNLTRGSVVIERIEIGSGGLGISAEALYLG